MDACLAVDAKKENNATVALAVSSNNVYDGYIGDNIATDLVKTFIGVRKKNSNEVSGNDSLDKYCLTEIGVFPCVSQIKLVEVKQCHMLSYHYDNVAEHKTRVVTGLTTESARKLLFKDFGGKKALKVFERKEKMKVNVDVVKEQLDKTLLGKVLKEKQNISMNWIVRKIKINYRNQHTKSGGR